MARLGAALALLLVATFYLLASIPFAYYHFLQFPHFWWLPAFIRFHPLVLAAAVAILVSTLRGLSQSIRPWVRYIAIVGAMTGLTMASTVLWPATLTYEMAAALCFLPIIILGMAGATDLAAHRAAVSAGDRYDSRSLMTGVAFAAPLSAAVYLLQAGLLAPAAQVRLQPLEIVVVAAASLLGHLAVFGVALLAVLIPRAAVARRGWSAWREYLGALAGGALVVAVLIRRVLLASLILGDLRAIAIAVTLASALVVYGAALVLRSRTAGHHVGSGFSRIGWPKGIAAVTVIAVCVGVLPRLLLLADWGTTLQQLVVCVTWAASIVLLIQVRAGRLKRFALAGVAVMVAAGIGSATIAARQPSAERTVGANGGTQPLDAELAIERFATIDMSLRVVLDLVRPVVADNQFFYELERVGDVTDSKGLKAVPLRVVDEPGPAPAYRPNIFIIVVDSLRPDYLSAYNHDVTFTPAIGSFAAESIVMRRAFTPYTGTALSEPALWAGGLIPRRMYVQPFSAVNNLERLALAGGYRRYISVDEILSVIVGDWSNVVRLDAQLAHPEREDEMFKFDLCSTLTELADRIDHEKSEAAPVFFFSQPQSLHIRVLSDDKFPRYDVLRSGESLFFKPAVAALGRIDACFGQFMTYLKARKLYDDSIVILTSDHGDFHGEGGRWGHAFYLAPETVRIPLIMHVPERLRAGRHWDQDEVAMLTDVTPTLYELLGYGPISSQELVGRPLLTRTDGPSSPRRDMYLMQSSYSRIFGLLDGDAQWMYTASANQVREEFFDMRGGQVRPRSLSPAERLQYRKWLLDRIARVNAQYRP